MKNIKLKPNQEYIVRVNSNDLVTRIKVIDVTQNTIHVQDLDNNVDLGRMEQDVFNNFCTVIEEVVLTELTKTVRSVLLIDYVRLGPLQRSVPEPKEIKPDSPVFALKGMTIVEVTYEELEHIVEFGKILQANSTRNKILDKLEGVESKDYAAHVNIFLTGMSCTNWEREPVAMMSNFRTDNVADICKNPLDYDITHPGAEILKEKLAAQEVHDLICINNIKYYQIAKEASVFDFEIES